MRLDARLIAQRGGFWKAYGYKLRAPFRSYAERHTDNVTAFNESLNRNIDNINLSIRASRTRINQLKNIQNPTADQTALLNNEKLNLTFLMEELKLAKMNKNQFLTFSNIAKKSKIDNFVSKPSKAKSTIQGYRPDSRGNITIQGVKINPNSKQYNQFVNNMMKAQLQYEKGLQSLANSKASMMRAMSKNPEKYTTELQQYVGTPTDRGSLWNPRNWGQNAYSKAIGGHQETYRGKFLAYTLCGKSTRLPLVAAGAVNPTYGSPFMLTSDLNKEDTESYIQQADTAIESLTQLRDAMENAKSEEELAQAIAAYEQIFAAPQEDTTPQNTEQEAETAKTEQAPQKPSESEA